MDKQSHSQRRDFNQRPPQICVLGSADPGSKAYELAGNAGEFIARAGFTVISGCGSPATRYAAERALKANGSVVSIVPSDDINTENWPCTVLIPCGMGDARNLMMALAGDACLVIGGRAGTISEVCLAWLHHRPLLPLTGCGGWSDQLENSPPDERKNSEILPWGSIEELETQFKKLGFFQST
ncbi:MAG: hypothetical protein KTR14_00360 [Vampirovibrio sp.]|nr:hypothetical protein [Vampirovibrio sp.]